MTWDNRLANILNSLRLIPRVLIIMYMIAVGMSLQWYFDFEVRYVTNCDAAVMSTLLRNEIDLSEVKLIACTDTEVIGQPLGYTALMSTLVGSGAMIFGFYVNSGNKNAK